MNIPQNAILIRPDVVRLYPNIAHNFGLKTFHNMLGARGKKANSGVAIGTKFASPYPYVYG